MTNLIKYDIITLLHNKRYSNERVPPDDPKSLGGTKKNNMNKILKIQRKRILELDWIANKLGPGLVWGPDIPGLFNAWLENIQTDIEVNAFLLR